MVPQRTPSNVPGPFYVAKDECISCGAPEAEAPTLMAHDDVNGSCYFKRQPETPDETYRALRAMWASCCGAVRYGGDDPVTLHRLRSMGLDSRVDSRAGTDSPLVLRDRATFDYDLAVSAEQVIAEIAARLTRLPTSTISAPVSARTWSSLTWSWAPTIRAASIEIVVHDVGDGNGRWMVCIGDPNHPAARSTATSIDDALRGMEAVRNVRWYTRDDWDGDRSAWNSLPI